MNNENRETLLNNLIDSGDIEGIEKIVRNGRLNYERLDPLHYAIRQDNSVVVNSLLGSGLDPNGLDVYGRTPLVACIQLRGDNMFDIAQQLIVSGADIDKRDVTGFTPLMLCVHYDHTIILIEMIKYLITRGADVNAVCNRCTPLQSPGISLRVFKILLEAGATYNDQIIMHAVQNPSCGRLELLMQHGLDVNRVIGGTYGFGLSVIQILQEEVDSIILKCPVFGLLDYVKNYNLKNSAITIQCCVRMYLSKLRADILRSTPKNLFDDEFTRVRFRMLTMEGF